MQTQNALNDNLAKFLLVPLGGWLVAQGMGFAGLQHVLTTFEPDPDVIAPGGNNLVFSPNEGTVNPNTNATVSVDVFIGAVGGASYQVAPQTPRG